MMLPYSGRVALALLDLFVFGSVLRVVSALPKQECFFSLALYGASEKDDACALRSDRFRSIVPDQITCPYFFKVGERSGRLESIVLDMVERFHSQVTLVFFLPRAALPVHMTTSDQKGSDALGRNRFGSRITEVATLGSDGNLTGLIHVKISPAWLHRIESRNHEIYRQLPGELG